jgi:CRISPR-associated endonuclease Cas1
MHPHVTAPRDGIAVAHGFGIKIHVSRGHLVVEDGICDERQTRRFNRATSNLTRLVVVGQTGYVTLEALRWLRDVGAAFIQLDNRGRLVALSAAPGPNLAALRRQQALAPISTAGLDIARWLLTTKITGQRALLSDLPGGAGAEGAIDQALADLKGARDLQTVLLAEALAAEAYWEAWRELPFPFPARDHQTVPDHWRTFGQRRSLLTNGPRNATNPAGALLNMIYALIEAETTLALHAVGLDPGIGIFHTDRRDRNSLTLDLMEAIRPAGDAYVLTLLTQRTLNARDFIETRKGGCRLHPNLARTLLSTLPGWREHAAPVAEHVAHAFAHAAPGELPLLTPLTRHNHHESWKRRAPDHRTRDNTTGLALPPCCPDCGATLPDRRRRYCETCTRERIARRSDSAREAAAVVLAQLRAEQRDPAHGGHAAQIRGAKNAAHQRAVHAWAGERSDPSVFTREILPGLRSIPVPELAAATGLSQVYCSLIRLGKKTPHPRHWDALRHLVGFGVGGERAR